MNLQTNYIGLPLTHPVIAGASPLTATFDGIRRLEDAGASAIVTASVYEEELRSEEQALDAAINLGAESQPEATNYAPRSYEHDPLAMHLEMVRRASESVAIPIMASVHGVTRTGWTRIAANLQDAGAAALEINLFHIPTDPAESMADAARRLVGAVREVCTTVRIPVAVKLSPYFSAPTEMAAALAGAGAEAVVLFDRLYEPEIDLDTMAYRPTLELSTARDSRRPLLWIALLAGQTKLALGASGGVAGPEEVVKYLLAGADTVQTASALLRHGPGYLRQLVDGLASWLAAHDAASVDAIRGRLSLRRTPHPEGLLQAQHTSTLLRESPWREHTTDSLRHGRPPAEAGGSI